jgi:hypothetical protein
MGFLGVGEAAKGEQLIANQGKEWMGICATSKKAGSLSKFFIMYFSLPESIPPRPLGGARVRRQWSAFIYMSRYSSHYIK